MCDNSVMVCNEKLRFFVFKKCLCYESYLGYLRLYVTKLLVIIIVRPSDMDEQLVPLFLGPNERFWGGRTVDPLWGTFITRTKRV